MTDTQYTRYGEAARVQLGETGKRAWQSYYYDAHTRRLERTIVDAEVARPMQSDVNYHYDPFGNITSVADTPQERPADVQCFRYDHLRRLTEAWTPGNGCDDDPSTAALAGPAPYWQSFSYDEVGNRLTETAARRRRGHTCATYGYPQAGAHAVKSVTTTGPAGTKKDEFAYDATGNTTARTRRPARSSSLGPGGEARQGHRGRQVDEYVYDADGNRLIRRDPTGTTLYLDGQELRLDKATGKLTGTRYYGTAGSRGGPDRCRPDLAGGRPPGHGTVADRQREPNGSPAPADAVRRARGAAADFPGEKGFVGGTKERPPA